VVGPERLDPEVKKNVGGPNQKVGAKTADLRLAAPDLQQDKDLN